MVNDVHRYSEGLILALRNDKFKEADGYVKKMSDQLNTIKTYIRMKEKI